MKKISIIVPIYNVEKYLKKCIESIKKQSYDNFEAICIIDGSKDNSERVLVEETKNDKRFKIFKRENRGLLYTRVEGLSRASGEFVTFIDSDDWVDEDYLEKLIESQEKNGSDLVVCNMKFVSETDEKVLINDKPLTCKIYNQNEIKSIVYKELCLGNKFNNACRQLIRKDLFDLKKINTEISMGEDLELNLSFYDNVIKLSTIDYSGYNYRYNPNGISKSQSDTRIKNNFKDETNVYYDLVKFIEQNNNCLKEYSYARFIMQFNTYLMNLSLLSKISFFDFYSIVKKEFLNDKYLIVKNKIKMKNVRLITNNKKRLFCYLLLLNFRLIYALLTYYIVKNIWIFRRRKNNG